MEGEGGVSFLQAPVSTKNNAAVSKRETPLKETGERFSWPCDWRSKSCEDTRHGREKECKLG